MAKKVLNKKKAQKKSAKTDKVKPVKVPRLKLQTPREAKTPIHYLDETKVHPALKSFFCYCLTKAALVHKNQVEEALTHLGVQALHLGTMGVIDASVNISQNQAADEMGIDKASMVKIIDSLEVLEVIERRQSAKDRRVNFLTLTPKGKTILQQGIDVALKIENDLFKDFDPREVEIFKKCLIKVLDKSYKA